MRRLLRRLKAKYDIILDIIIVLIFLCLLTFLLIKQPLTSKADYQQLLSNLFDFSSVFSGILIAYITFKVSQIRTEREQRKLKILELSNKVTDFRRICDILKSQRIWNQELLNSLKKNYSKLSYHHFFLSLDDKEPEEIKKSKESFYKFEDISSEGGAYLFFALKTIGFEESLGFFTKVKLSQIYDYDIEYPYELQCIWTDSHCASSLWTWLVDRGGISQQVFDLDLLLDYQKSDLSTLVAKIDPSKFGGRDLSRKLLAEVGTDFDEFYFPKLRELTFLNLQPYSRTMKFLVHMLLIIVATGILIPLFISVVEIKDISVEFIKIKFRPRAPTCT